MIFHEFFISTSFKSIDEIFSEEYKESSHSSIKSHLDEVTIYSLVISEGFH